jgi:hypothetical protein
MACALTQGYTLGGCKDGVGGIKEAYFIEWGGIASITEASGVVTAITKTASMRFWKYELQRETSTFKEGIEGNPANGTVVYRPELTVILNRLQTSVRNEILLLAKNLLVAVVLDRNGKYWLLGKGGGLDLTTGEAGPGTAATDRSGYTLTFTGSEAELAVEVDSATAATLTTPG